MVVLRRAAILSSLACFAACGYDGVGTATSSPDDVRASGAGADASVDSGLIREDDPPAPIDLGDGAVDYVDAAEPDAAVPFDAGPLPTSPGSPLVYVVSTRFWTFNPVGGAWAGGTQFPTGSCPYLDEIAVDPFGKILAVGNAGKNLYQLDPSSVSCTAVGPGNTTYPQALSFAPRGTLDPYVEQLVGYGANGDYVRIDTTTGALSLVKAGVFAGYSVGDLVNVGTKGYVALTGGACGSGDCIWEVSLTTGDKIGAAPIGTLPATKHVTGLGHWGGKLYAFCSPDEVWSIDPATPGAAVKLGGPPGDVNVAFRGAGSRTIAPVN
jgi:hypothetical protein